MLPAYADGGFVNRLAAWWRARRGSGGGARGAYEAAFSQSPHGMLVVDGKSLEIVDANPALLGSLG